MTQPAEDLERVLAAIDEARAEADSENTWAPFTQKMADYWPTIRAALRERRELREQRANLVAALQRIRTEGQVCDDYADCDHRACESSYRAWAIADEALAALLAQPAAGEERERG